MRTVVKREALANFHCNHAKINLEDFIYGKNNHEKYFVDVSLTNELFIDDVPTHIRLTDQELMDLMFYIRLSEEKVIFLRPIELSELVCKYNEMVEDGKAQPFSLPSETILANLQSFKLDKTSYKTGIYTGHYSICLAIGALSKNKVIFESASTANVMIQLPEEFIQMLMHRLAEPTYITLKEEINNMDNIEKKEVKKENKSMKMPAMKLNFGPIDSDLIAVSPYGLAIKDKDGNAFTYNPATAQTVDVTGFTFNFPNMIYKIPVAVSALAPGDMIVHNNKPMYVTDIEGTCIDVIDLLDSEIKTVIPVTNMFGFNFVTKITSMMNLGNITPSAEQPFGNIMPIMMASMMFNNSEEEDEKIDFGKMFMMSAMLNGGNGNPFAAMFNVGQPQSQQQ